MRRSIALVVLSLALPFAVIACSGSKGGIPNGPAPEYEPGRTWVGTGASAHPLGSASSAPR